MGGSLARKPTSIHTGEPLAACGGACGRTASLARANLTAYLARLRSGALDLGIGVDVHRTRRIMGAAHDGQVLPSERRNGCSNSSIALRDLGEHASVAGPAGHAFSLGL